MCALNAVWVCHHVRLGWLTPIPIPSQFPHSCSHRTTSVAFRPHCLWNLAGSSAGPDTGGYVNSSTKQLPSPLGWRPGMPWVSPAGLAPLGISVSPCQTPRLALYWWWGGLCQQDEALHCRTAESKALEGRQRQQKACSVSQNTADRRKYKIQQTADRRKHPPEEEEVTQRQKLRGKNSQGSSTLPCRVWAQPLSAFVSIFIFPKKGMLFKGNIFWTYPYPLDIVLYQVKQMKKENQTLNILFHVEISFF